MTKSLQPRLFGAALSLGLVAALTALPVAATTADYLPLSEPSGVLMLVPTPVAGQELARRGRGADDAPGHVRGGGKGRGRGADDGPNHTLMQDGTDAPLFARRGRGADDAPGHVRGGGKGRGRGADDGPNHTLMLDGTDAPLFARRGRGADDAPGHVRGGGKGRGRGADDGPNHA